MFIYISWYPAMHGKLRKPMVPYVFRKDLCICWQPGMNAKTKKLWVHMYFKVCWAFAGTLNAWEHTEIQCFLCILKGCGVFGSPAMHEKPARIQMFYQIDSQG